MKIPNALPFLIALSTSIALGQTAPATVERVFSFAPTDTPPSIQEIVNTFRSIAEIRQVRVDQVARTATVQASPWQADLAEWLIHQLDNARPGASAEEYTIPGNQYDVVEIFRPSQARSPQQLQEIINCIRSIAGVQRVLGYTASAAIVARWTAPEIQFSEWLVQHLDAPPVGQLSASYSLDQIGGQPPTAVRLYYFSPTMTAQRLQEVVNRIRTEAQIQRTVGYTAGRAIVLRAQEGQIAAAEQIVAQARQ